MTRNFPDGNPENVDRHHFKTQLSKSRGCLRSKASKGEAVVSYCEPLATKEMGYHRLSWRVNKMMNFKDFLQPFNTVDIRASNSGSYSISYQYVNVVIIILFMLN